MAHSLFSPIGGCDALRKVAHRYGPIGENERQDCTFSPLPEREERCPAEWESKRRGIERATASSQKPVSLTEGVVGPDGVKLIEDLTIAIEEDRLREVGSIGSIVQPYLMSHTTVLSVTTIHFP